jgi:PAS domain S-box-containing protein
MARLAGEWWIASRGFPAVPSAAEEESIDNLAQPVLALDADGAIVYANKALGRTFGIKPRNMNGRQIGELVPATAATQLRDLFDATDAQHSGRLAVASLLRLVDADGREFPAEITIATADRRDAELVFAMVTDVSYRSKLRQLVAERDHARPTLATASS